MPHVFFRCTTAVSYNSFPVIAGMGGAISLREPRRTRVVPIARVLGLQSHRVCEAPPIARVFARGERKGGQSGLVNLSGTEPFNGIILPLISDVGNNWQQVTSSGASDWVWPRLTLAICVLDGPMVLAEGTPEQPRLSLQPWVRVSRLEEHIEAGDRRSTHYIIDVVHREFFVEGLEPRRCVLGLLL